MSHYYKVIVCFKSAIDIANKKIEEYQAKLILEDGKKMFYDKVIIIGYIIRDIYSAFDKNNFDNLQELNNRYNEEMINTLDILEQLVKQSIYTENEYIAYANSFMERKRDYDILCNNPENVKGIPLCECCIPKNIL
jgi:hypothetical protein